MSFSYLFLQQTVAVNASLSYSLPTDEWRHRLYLSNNIGWWVFPVFWQPQIDIFCFGGRILKSVSANYVSKSCRCLLVFPAQVFGAVWFSHMLSYGVYRTKK